MRTPQVILGAALAAETLVPLVTRTESPPVTAPIVASFEQPKPKEEHQEEHSCWVISGRHRQEIQVSARAFGPAAFLVVGKTGYIATGAVSTEGRST